MERRFWFMYGIPETVLGAVANVATPVTLTIGSDAPFEIVYITAIAIQANVIVQTWPGLVQIEDNAPSFVLSNVPIAFNAIAGDGQQPYPVTPNRLIDKASTLTLTFTQTVAVATSVAVVFHGNKIYERR